MRSALVPPHQFCTKCGMRLVVVDVEAIGNGAKVMHQCLFCDLGAVREKPRMGFDELGAAMGLEPEGDFRAPGKDGG